MGKSGNTFMGEYTHNMDDKNRLSIPAAFRERSPSGFVLTTGLEKCLFLFTLNEWKRITEKLRRFPITKQDARGFLRIFLAGATHCPLDTQGRILIPRSLCEYAALKKATVLIGVLDRIEIWNIKVWEEYRKSVEHQLGDIAEKLSELGL